ncbi:hypothetical protein ACF08O_31685 [Streptomyces paradoxus]|uniref:hypothetical protein n=1 Tax=Streptomyces paradoxus TaxID=66375 RepID=UPI0036FF86E6
MTIADVLTIGLPKRRGRRLSPISEEATPEHREWLVPLREAYVESGLNYRKLKGLALTSEAQLSRLLTGAKDYPDLVRVLDVHDALSTVVEFPHTRDWYQKTWEAGAWAAKRPDEWIKDCMARVAKSPAGDGDMPCTKTVSKSPFARFPRAASCLAGMVTTALLASLLQLFGVGLPGASSSTVPDHTACGRDVRCLLDSRRESLRELTPVPVRGDRLYVSYPNPAPSVRESAFVRAWLAEDAPVYDNRRELRRLGSRTLYVSAGSTVYLRCTDQKDFVVLYGGEGDRLRSEAVRRLVERLDGLRRLPDTDPTECLGDVG